MCVCVSVKNFSISQNVERGSRWVSSRRTYCQGAMKTQRYFQQRQLVVAFRRSRGRRPSEALLASCLWCSFIWPPGLLFTGVCPSINYCSQLLYSHRPLFHLAGNVLSLASKFSCLHRVSRCRASFHPRSPRFKVCRVYREIHSNSSASNSILLD